jgi:hypothetical protein
MTGSAPCAAKLLCPAVIHTIGAGEKCEARVRDGRLAERLGLVAFECRISPEVESFPNHRRAIMMPRVSPLPRPRPDAALGAAGPQLSRAGGAE